MSLSVWIKDRIRQNKCAVGEEQKAFPPIYLYIIILLYILLWYWLKCWKTLVNPYLTFYYTSLSSSTHSKVSAPVSAAHPPQNRLWWAKNYLGRRDDNGKYMYLITFEIHFTYECMLVCYVRIHNRRKVDKVNTLQHSKIIWNVQLLQRSVFTFYLHI